ncbi:MAG: hypothetical protein V4710_09905, partial [Verrucomicrobiota bacterium]
MTPLPWFQDRFPIYLAPMAGISDTIFRQLCKEQGADVMVTLKCGGCGAEVVVNTAEQMGARCHWCRHVLTVNEQIPNGAVPD